MTASVGTSTSSTSSSCSSPPPSSPSGPSSSAACSPHHPSQPALPGACAAPPHALVAGPGGSTSSSGSSRSTFGADVGMMNASSSSSISPNTASSSSCSPFLFLFRIARFEPIETVFDSLSKALAQHLHDLQLENPSLAHTGDLKELQRKVIREGQLFVDPHSRATLLFEIAQREKDDEAVRLSKFLIEELGVLTPDMRDRMQQTCLFYSAREGHIALSDYYIKQGCSPNLQDSVGQTCLFYAAREGRSTCLGTIIDHGGDPNILDINKQTCLFYAARDNRLEAVRVLLEKGADPHIKDTLRKTAWHFAKSNNHLAVCTLLKNYTAGGGGAGGLFLQPSRASSSNSLVSGHHLASSSAAGAGGVGGRTCSSSSSLSSFSSFSGISPTTTSLPPSSCSSTAGGGASSNESLLPGPLQNSVCHSSPSAAAGVPERKGSGAGGGGEGVSFAGVGGSHDDYMRGGRPGGGGAGRGKNVGGKAGYFPAGAGGGGGGGVCTLNGSGGVGPGPYSNFGVCTGADEVHLQHMQRKKYRLQFQPLPEECPDLWLFAGPDKLAEFERLFPSLAVWRKDDHLAEGTAEGGGGGGAAGKASEGGGVVGGEAKTPSDHYEALHEALRQNSQYLANGGGTGMDLLSLWQSAALSLLSELSKYEGGHIFEKPVDPKTAPGYYDIVTHPISFSCIKAKIKKSVYTHPMQFLQDVEQVFINCEMYNQQGSWVWSIGKNMQKFFSNQVMMSRFNDYIEKYKKLYNVFLTCHEDNRRILQQQRQQQQHQRQQLSSSSSSSASSSSASSLPLPQEQKEKEEEEEEDTDGQKKKLFSKKRDVSAVHATGLDTSLSDSHAASSSASAGEGPSEDPSQSGDKPREAGGGGEAKREKIKKEERDKTAVDGGSTDSPEDASSSSRPSLSEDKNFQELKEAPPSEEDAVVDGRSGLTSREREDHSLTSERPPREKSAAASSFADTAEKEARDAQAEEEEEEEEEGGDPVGNAVDLPQNEESTTKSHSVNREEERGKRVGQEDLSSLPSSSSSSSTERDAGVSTGNTPNNKENFADSERKEEQEEGGGEEGVQEPKEKKLKKAEADDQAKKGADKNS